MFPTLFQLPLWPTLQASWKVFLILIVALFIVMSLAAKVGEKNKLMGQLLLILQQISGDGPATVYQINQVSLRQTITPERLLGRVNASVEFFRLGSTLAGSLLGGLLGEMIGVRATLFFGAFGTLLSTLWLVLSPVRALRTTPASPVEPEHGG